MQGYEALISTASTLNKGAILPFDEYLILQGTILKIFYMHFAFPS